MSTEFINELQPVHILSSFTLTFLLFLLIIILGFTKTKIKLKDILFVAGFWIFSLMTVRNLYFLYFIGMIYFTNIITSFIDTYNSKEEQLFTKMENSTVFIMVFCTFILIISICMLPTQLSKEYVRESKYPIYATKWIKENLDYKNIRMWNNFDWGSYLELNGIKVFLDSRSGMYTVQENKGCTVLQDWLSVTRGSVHYQEIFDKYNINYVLVENSELLNTFISKDYNYKIIYQDNLFTLYEKK